MYISASNVNINSSERAALGLLTLRIVQSATVRFAKFTIRSFSGWGV
jgi:hypothetical protein